MDDSQHGFRPRRSTTSALLPLTTAIADGFNEAKPPKRTVVVAVDLSRAFDTVNHDLLLQKVYDTNLNSNLVRWLSTYPRGREQAVVYNGQRSPFKRINRGVPQGAVISPTLFNLYVADFPAILSEKTSFADDFSIYTSAVNIEDAERQLSHDMELVKDWAASIELDISTQKSTVTLFSPLTHKHKYHPQVKLGNSFLPLAQHPKILGVTLDPLFTFSPHVRETAKGAAERLKVIKALAGTSWGQDAETPLMTYKTIIRTKLDYAAPVWSPNVKPSPVKRLQSIQNAGLRLVTGCHRMASESHLHSETKVLPVQDHVDMLSAQYLASSLRDDHPANESVKRPARRRNKKHTLQLRHSDVISSLLADGSLPAGAFPEAKKLVHTKFVESAITNQDNHPLIGTRAPVIDKSEQTLPRHHRSVLSQLRSGHCSSLRNYQHRIGKADSPTCPHCGASDETVHHLFNCPSHITDLTIIDLWRHPVRVANHISSHPSFDLTPPPPLPRPPLRPPAEPPP